MTTDGFIYADGPPAGGPSCFVVRAGAGPGRPALAVPLRRFDLVRVTGLDAGGFEYEDALAVVAGVMAGGDAVDLWLLAHDHRAWFTTGGVLTLSVVRRGPADEVFD